MTCIIGLEYNGNAYVGADSASVDDWIVQPTRIQKIFRRDDFLIGYTTSFRMGQILQFHLDVPIQEEESDLEFMVVKFVGAVRSCLKDEGFTKIEHNVEKGGTFIVAYHGRIYECGPDFQVNSSRDGLNACGHGYTLALGAMKALDQYIDNPVARIREALKIAAYFDGDVCPPFLVMENFGDEETQGERAEDVV
jgi:ATP-dependent protease HslVU (ClpYQ) peptidase subunit